MRKVILGILGLLFLASCTEELGTQKLPLGYDDSINFQTGLSASDIRSLCKSEQDKFQKSQDAVAALTSDQANFKTAVLALENATTLFSNNVTIPNFLKYVSPDAKVREAAGECETEVSQYFVDIYTREDLFKAIKAASQKREKLDPQSKQLLEETLSRFTRNGLDLPADKRKIYIEKKKELVKAEFDYSTNLDEYEDELVVTKEQLEGLSDSYIQGLKKTAEGKYRVTMVYPDYYPFMQNAKNAEMRKLLDFKFDTRAGLKNKELLDRAIVLRRELAQMLGYKTHADFVLEKRMAKTPEKVTEGFLKPLIEKLKPIGKQNLSELLELKRKELNDPTVKDIFSYDWRYYDNQLRKSKFQIDNQKIKEYFPIEVVNQGLFEIYQTLLGVKFVAENRLPKWHDSIYPFRIERNGQTVAYFYMDLFPRQGKYGHAASFTLINGYLQPDGKYRAPVSAIVANFNAPQPGQPSLLEHSEVVTLFHEFGHVMHQVLTTAAYGSFSGTNVLNDYVEAPSQMLENWVYQPEALKKLSGHYLDNTKKLPDELIEKISKAKKVDSGILYLRQASFASLDMEYHTASSVDSTEIYQKAMRDIMMVPVQQGTYPQASFGHLMGGYDAGYYGYLWSEVYAADMFQRFAKEGLLNPVTGADYLRWILQPGGTQDPFVLITGFLGRAPNQDAFLKGLGLSQ